MDEGGAWVMTKTLTLWGQGLAAVGPLHLIGIGGIGMSGLAEVLAKAGASVQGSDQGGKDAATLARLTAAGVRVWVGHAAAQVQGAQVVVVSTAIAVDNVELVAAKAAGLKVLHRAELLAELMKNYRAIAVSGTHGKTTTTALVYTAMKAGGAAVGIINGGILQDLGTNAVLPPKVGDWLVVEADESDASFLNLAYEVAVVTNIEPEHMDTYGSETKLVQAFVDFASRAKVAVLCVDDPNTAIVATTVATQGNTEVVTYGFADDADVVAETYAPQLYGPQGGGMAFDAVVRGARLEDVVVSLPGAHYVLNSLAALAVAQLAVPAAQVAAAADGLATFGGVGRRFTQVGFFHGATVIDDYGHHPTEIAATLDAAKQRFRGRVVAIIQPHRYTRLRDLMSEFATCAQVADACVLLPVYGAGEAVIEGVSHTALAERMTLPEEVKVVAADHPTAELDALESGLIKALHHLHVGPEDAVICLGAGTITELAGRLAAHHHH
jgi:UDP-N-acetylmuramate--alanine ligase